MLRDILQPVVASAGVGLALGVVDLVVVAFAEQRHYGDDAVAWTLAALSAGSAVGGLLNGGVAWRVPARARLALTLAGLGLALVGAGLASGLGTLAVALACAGFFVAPALTTAYLIADETATPEARVRAGAWVNTGVNAGSTAGAAAAGLMVGGVPTALCFAAAGTAALLTAAAVGGGGRAGLRPKAGHGHALERSSPDTDSGDAFDRSVRFAGSGDARDRSARCAGPGDVRERRAPGTGPGDASERSAREVSDRGGEEAFPAA